MIRKGNGANEKGYSTPKQIKEALERAAAKDYAQIPKCRCGTALVKRMVGDHEVLDCPNPMCNIGVPEVRDYGSRFEN
ncbi:hypothetical protein M1116_00115 [Patescibacteria group bacterium]|nr:hypothetical protein [Patescibacteria group bacterium]